MYSAYIEQRIERYRNFFKEEKPDIMVCVSPYTFQKAFHGYSKKTKDVVIKAKEKCIAKLEEENRKLKNVLLEKTHLGHMRFLMT